MHLKNPEDVALLGLAGKEVSALLIYYSRA